MSEFTTDTQEKTRHHIKVQAKGRILEITKGVSRTNIPFVNFILETVGKKYTEKLPFVSYGALVEAIVNSTKVGDTVQIYGRVRSKDRDGRISISLVCEQFDVIK